ncbi:hypothetical protein F3I02_10930 [Bacillus sp. SRB3LM]|nr:hypothetical protein [Bacillus sp. SRB3LM]
MGINTNARASLKNKVHFVFPWVDELGGHDTLKNAFVFQDLYPQNVMRMLDSATCNFVGSGFPAEKGYIETSNSLTIVQKRINNANAVKLLI